ncbi:hypothetical protein B4168_3326 [Anoxybacillus flavithermus]|nr:hypothetical protein B4168_3326 [Anoxybacillus flavithermus]OAO85102.1 hypothetical protein GT23_3156 [Parageobacillus thermoglucosidasius]
MNLPAMEKRIFLWENAKNMMMHRFKTREGNSEETAERA